MTEAETGFVVALLERGERERFRTRLLLRREGRWQEAGPRRCCSSAENPMRTKGPVASSLPVLGALDGVRLCCALQPVCGLCLSVHEADEWANPASGSLSLSFARIRTIWLEAPGPMECLSASRPQGCSLAFNFARLGFSVVIWAWTKIRSKFNV